MHVNLHICIGALLATIIAWTMIGCDTGPTAYDSIFEERIKAGDDRTTAFFAALEPYEAIIEERMPAQSYARNDLTPSWADERTLPKWTETEELRIKFPFLANEEIFAAWYLAQIAGYFQEAGLNVTLSLRSKGEPHYESLKARETEVFIEPVGNRLIEEVAEGGKFVAVQRLFEINPNVVAALDASIPKDERSDSTLTPDGLRHNVVGLHGGGRYLAGVFRDRWGIDPLQVKYIYQAPFSSGELIRGRTTLMVADVGNLVATMTAKRFRNWVQFALESHAIREPSWLSVFNADFVADKPEVVKRYNWAIMKAVADILADPKAVAKKIKKSLSIRRSETFIANAWQARLPFIKGSPFTPHLRIHMGTMNQTAAVLLQQKRIDIPGPEHKGDLPISQN